MTSPRRRKSAAPADRVVAYIRVSTDEQTESGAGLDAQRAAITAEVDRHGWTVTAWYSDEGISGTKSAAQRPGLAAALEAVQSDVAGTLVVAKLDRLARNFRYAVNLIADAEEQGWNVYSCDGTVDMTTPAARFQTRVMIGVTELERDMIAQRTRDALAAKKAQGIRLGRPSVLHREVVSRIVTEREERRSLRAIAEGLTADGIPTARGKTQWSTSSVQAVLAGQDAAAVRTARGLAHTLTRE
ncbi:recombinase family protein [Rhodococcus sp. HNM0563]|nr:recombinase family protein [Rhodococcus sp. HNM0563]